MDIVTWLKAAVLGLVEGITEFIPVSSTGHLILTQKVLGFQGAKENAFVIFIQFGAILAVVWLYRRKFLDLLLHWQQPRQRQLILNLIIATLPAVVVGLPTENWIEVHFFKPLPVALAFVGGGLAILALEARRRTVEVATVDDIPWRRALGIGVVQVLSIIFPGVSRAGATIMGGLGFGLSRTAATEFSFFLAVPAMLGATAIKMFKVRDLVTSSDLPVFAIGFAVAFVSALIVIRKLLSYVAQNSFRPFAWYRIVVGAAVVAAVLLGFGQR
jgi:undecaprenyl-diphosphatase